jgi:2',3'-cyclic-nucleotide 2'-phosphodiesterase (5'-nucleotidase family)
LLEVPLRIGDTWIVQAGAHGTHVGWVTIDPSQRQAGGPLIGSGGVLPTDSLPEDRSVLALADAAEAADGDIIGYVDAEFPPRDKHTPCETPLGNLYADLFRAHAGADVAVLPWGLFARTLSAGPIRRYTLAQITSRERVAVTHLTGRELCQLLNRGAM